VTAGILVDTHILLWARTRPEILQSGELRAIEAARTRYVSAVSLWEFAILISLGRIEANPHLMDAPEGFDLLPIQPAHCQSFASLPRLHGDPFDRMLIAQAQTEQLSLLTRDRVMLRYTEHAGILRVPQA
jgi:PIN domain nuclease of toxin-antitoxin system